MEHTQCFGGHAAQRLLSFKARRLILFQTYGWGKNGRGILQSERTGCFCSEGIFPLLLRFSLSLLTYFHISTWQNQSWVFGKSNWILNSPMSIFIDIGEGAHCKNKMEIEENVKVMEFWNGQEHLSLAAGSGHEGNTLQTWGMLPPCRGTLLHTSLNRPNQKIDVGTFTPPNPPDPD